MTDRSTRRRVAEALGGLFVVGTVGCLVVTVVAGTAVVGGGAGYLVGGGELLAVAAVKLTVLALFVLWRVR